MSKPKLALILGSGFSREAGIPTTSELSRNFLTIPERGVLSKVLEERVTEVLQKFWSEVFGYVQGNHPPLLEDHFTMLDLSANSGHNLGHYWSPKRLRAVRRMSIHRVFQILDAAIGQSGSVDTILQDSQSSFDRTITSLNWDIVVEKRLFYDVDYGIETVPFSGCQPSISRPLLLKLHGSSNWVYCDACRRIYSGSEKEALLRKTFLENADFELFDSSGHGTYRELQSNADRKCHFCDNEMGGRVATFSYRKAFSISQFRTIWSRALETLRDADLWLFVGYSMPHADFEFRNLLKTAQLARKNRPHIQVVVKRTKDWDGGVENFQRFLGSALDDIYDGGLANWVELEWSSFMETHGVA